MDGFSYYLDVLKSIGIVLIFIVGLGGFIIYVSRDRDIYIERIKTAIMKLKRGWGMMFRLLFIVTIGLIGYFWIDPHSIGDIPFSQLTLNHIFKNLSALILVVFCIAWFFKFPDQHEGMNDEGNPYNMWANFSGLLIIIGIIFWYCHNK